MAKATSPDAEKPPGSTRRELLNYAWLASLGILTAQIAGISLYLSLPRFGEGEFGGIIEIGPVSELPEVDSPPINNPDGKFWLMITSEGLLALYKVCTHLDCLIHWDEQERSFICPCHGSRFDRTGTYVSGPAPRSLDRFVAQVVSIDGMLLFETDSRTGGPLHLPVDTRDSAAGEAPAAQAESSDSDDAVPGATIEADSMIQIDTGRRISGQPPLLE